MKWSLNETDRSYTHDWTRWNIGIEKEVSDWDSRNKTKWWSFLWAAVVHTPGINAEGVYRDLNCCHKVLIVRTLNALRAAVGLRRRGWRHNRRGWRRAIWIARALCRLAAPLQSLQCAFTQFFQTTLYLWHIFKEQHGNILYWVSIFSFLMIITQYVKKIISERFQ